MSSHVDRWRAHPEVQALLVRAQGYRTYVYATTGREPDRFLVTEAEYRLLLRASSPGSPEHPLDPDDMRILGMRICRPERLAWYRANTSMDHVRIAPVRSQVIAPWDPVPCLSAPLERCRTERPAHPQRDIACPCGEVIWDLSTCLWDAVEMTRRMDQGVVRLMASMAQELCRAGPLVTDEPLPPLDDLDEGLQCQCCGRQHATFAEYMAHQRQHGEGSW